MADALDTAARAVDRALELLRVLNVEHTVEELHARARAVRHELETAQASLSRFATDIPAPREGKARRDAPETSEAAARAIRTQSGSQRHRVLRELTTWPELTDYQLQSRLRMGANSERPRRRELVEAGYVEPARTEAGDPITFKHPTSGMACQAWRLTEKGRAALARLNAGQMVLVEVSA